jgi:hypothetical protein
MIFTCTNVSELASKGIELLGEQLEIEVDPDLLLQAMKEDALIVHRIHSGTFHLHRPHKKFTLPRCPIEASPLFVLWIVTEDSYTDNLENDSFTYFKYIHGNASAAS